MFVEGDIVAERYCVVRELAQGGFSHAYLADDIHLGRRIVLKVSGAADNDTVLRWQREAGSLAGVDHPAFARFYEQGRLGDGRAYLTLEWVQGETLESIIRQRGALPVADGLTLARTLASGLADLHAAGIIHRDIKPSNVMVPAMGGDFKFSAAKLIDLGARGDLDSMRGGTRTTMSGQMFGTPRYMAPEQIQALPQSPATDVYGLGLLLYEGLFARLPFGEEDSAIAVMLRVLQNDAIIPEAPPVPPAVREFLVRALSRDPSRRPADGGAALRELEAIGLPRDTPMPPPVAAGAPRITLTAQSPARRSSLERAVIAAAPVNASTPRALAVAGTLGVVVVGLLIWAMVTRAGSPGSTGGPEGMDREAWLLLATGVALGALGLSAGLGLRAALRRRATTLQGDAERFLLGIETRNPLSQTLAIELRDLVARCREIDDRILGATIARMIGEYDAAIESDHRQQALMNAAQLLERLAHRLSPWYVRYQKQLAFTVSLVGLLSGAASVATAVRKLVVPGP